MLLPAAGDHPHRDIRLPVKQILKPIGEHQFDDDIRARLPEPGNQRRQHLRADHLAGGHPHHATQIGSVATKLAAVRSSARAVLSIASACTRSASAASVASRPVCERVNKAWPRAASSPAIWRPAVG